MGTGPWNPRQARPSCHPGDLLCSMWAGTNNDTSHAYALLTPYQARQRTLSQDLITLHAPALVEQGVPGVPGCHLVLAALHLGPGFCFLSFFFPRAGLASTVGRDPSPSSHGIGAPSKERLSVRQGFCLR